MTETQLDRSMIDGLDLPPAAELVAEAKAAMAGVTRLPRDPEAAQEARRRAASRALDQWKPGIDTLVDLSNAASFLGMRSYDSLKRNKYRKRADGSRMWPAADETGGRVGRGRAERWTLRTIVIHRAESPGRGHPGATMGRARTGRAQPAE